MKNLLQFLGEARTSQASAQAQKLNLKSDGHGSWFDSRGKLVAVTDKGRLKFTNKKPGAAQDEGPVKQMAQRRADDDLAGAPLQKKPASKPKAAKKEDPKKEKGEGDTLTTAFGRFNPPTTGHGKLLAAAKKAAAGGDLKIYPSRTQDPDRNPLDPDMKVSYMRKMFPDYEEEIINDPKMKTIFDVLGAASEEGYEFVNVVAGPDRINEFTKILQDYNGTEEFNFADGYNTVVSGPRDEDASGPEGDSATKQRKSIKDNDYDGFKKRLPKEIDDADALALFNATRQGMGIKASKAATKANKAAIALDANEECELWKIAPRLDPKGLREHYVKEEIYNLGDTVQNLNTGVVGRIIRRGTNHLICVTEEEMMFKAWIRDVMEYDEKKMDSMYREPGKPNTLVGTTGYLKYAQSMVPGSERGRQFINKHRKSK